MTLPGSQERGRSPHPDGSSGCARIAPGRLLIAIAAIAVSLQASLTSSQAQCPTSRPFASNPLFTANFPSPDQFEAVFWALGAGSPASGAGIDSGALHLCEWVYESEFTCWDSPSDVHIGGDWSDPSVDGCIDDVGASPAFEGDECMVMMFGAMGGKAAVWSEQGIPGTPPGRSFDIAQTASKVTFGSLAPPRVTGIDPIGGGLAEVSVNVPPGVARGFSLDPACSTGVLVGTELFKAAVAPGAAPPLSPRAGVGWSAATGIFPPGSEATVTLACSTGQDVYLSARPSFDSGFAPLWLSRPSPRINTTTDSDGDGTPDACDPCTDGDGDGAGDKDAPANACPSDNCPMDANPLQEDSDLDGVGDACDACPGFFEPNPRWLFGPATGLSSFVVPPGGTGVVYLAWDQTASFELYYVSAPGLPATRLSGPMILGGNVSEYRLTPDASRVVYLADQESDEVFDLYSAPIDGSSPSVRLSAPMAPGRIISLFEIAADSARVVYLAEQEEDNVIELFSVPVAGGTPPTKLNAPLDPLEDVLGMTLTPDATRVVYAPGDRNGFNWIPSDVASVPIGGGPVTSLTDLTDLGWKTLVTPDSSTVLYQGCEAGHVNCGMYRVPIEGGPSLRLTDDGGFSFRISPGAQTLVYVAPSVTPGAYDIFSVPLAGGPPTRLNKPWPPGSQGAGQTFFNFNVTPDGATLVYAAEQDTTGMREVYSVPVGGGLVTKLNGPLHPAGDVSDPLFIGFGADQYFEITPDGQTVIYRADQEVDERWEIFSVSLTGGPVTKLNSPLVGSEDVYFWEIVGDGATLAYQVGPWFANPLHLFTVPPTGGTALQISTEAFNGNISTPTGIPPKPENFFQSYAGTPILVYRSNSGLSRTHADCSLLSDAGGPGRGPSGGRKIRAREIGGRD